MSNDKICGIWILDLFCHLNLVLCAYKEFLMAHKKGQGSSRNGRDSNGQRRGVKAFGSQLVKTGSIIIRQVGTKIHPGRNVGMASDYTIYALVDGQVEFSRFGKDRKKVSVIPVQ